MQKFGKSHVNDIRELEQVLNKLLKVDMHALKKEVCEIDEPIWDGFWKAKRRF